jgi:hypothetical protein
VLKDDFSDLLDKWKWRESYQEECLEMVRNANQYMHQFQDSKVVKKESKNWFWAAADTDSEIYAQEKRVVQLLYEQAKLASLFRCHNEGCSVTALVFPTFWLCVGHCIFCVFFLDSLSLKNTFHLYRNLIGKRDNEMIGIVAQKPIRIQQFVNYYISPKARAHV